MMKMKTWIKKIFLYELKFLKSLESFRFFFIDFVFSLFLVTLVLFCLIFFTTSFKINETTASKVYSNLSTSSITVLGFYFTTMIFLLNNLTQDRFKTIAYSDFFKTIWDQYKVSAYSINLLIIISWTGNVVENFSAIYHIFALWIFVFSFLSLNRCIKQVFKLAYALVIEFKKNKKDTKDKKSTEIQEKNQRSLLEKIE